jgi:hypothetical protein
MMVLTTLAPGFSNVFPLSQMDGKKKLESYNAIIAWMTKSAKFT